MSLVVNYYGRIVALNVDKIVAGNNTNEINEVVNQIDRICLNFSNLVCEDENSRQITQLVNLLRIVDSLFIF